MSCLFHMMQKLRNRFYSLALLTTSLILKACNKGKIHTKIISHSVCVEEEAWKSRQGMHENVEIKMCKHSTQHDGIAVKSSLAPPTVKQR